MKNTTFSFVALALLGALSLTQSGCSSKKSGEGPSVEEAQALVQAGLLVDPGQTVAPGPLAITNTLKNFQFFTVGGVRKLSFDIYTLRHSDSSYKMGNSSYIVRFTTGTLSNPVLSNVNPKYTAGSPTGSYGAMSIQTLLTNLVGVQLYHTSGSGDEIFNLQGPLLGNDGERIATVTMNVMISSGTISLAWDTVNSLVVNTSFGSSPNSWNGSFSGSP